MPWLRNFFVKGTVFNLLARVVRRERGEDAWDALLDAAACDGVYTSLGTYPDAELVRLIRAAARTWHASPRAVLRWLGRHAVPLFARDHPALFAMPATRGSVPANVDAAVCAVLRRPCGAVIDPASGVGAGLRDARWRCDGPRRRLRGLALGWVEGVADYYGVSLDLDVDEPQCRREGDRSCSLVMHLSKTT